MKTPTNIGGNNLVTFLQQNTVFRMADLWTVTTVLGSVLRYTTWDTSLVILGNTFLTGPPNFTRSHIEEKIGLDVTALDMEVSASSTDLFDGIPILQAFVMGLFDGATVKIERLFMDSAGNQIGTVIRFLGKVGTVDEVGRSYAKVSVEALVNELQATQIPRLVLQPNCVHTLFDAGCTLRKKNMLTFSEQFDNAAWTDVAIVTPDTNVAPDGNTTADTLNDNSATAFLAKRQTVSVPADASTWTSSIYVLKTSSATNTFGVNLALSGGSVLNCFPRLNTNTGLIANSTGEGSISVADAGAYWRLTCSITNNGTNNSLKVSVFPATGTNVGSNPGTDNVAATGTAVVWGAQLEIGPLATSYEATTSTAASLFEANTAQAGSTVNKIISLSAKADGYYDNGQIVWTSGPNNGITKAVKNYLGQEFFFNSPLPFAPNAGDTFTAYPGDDKTQLTCQLKFSNLPNFLGFPYVPTPEAAI